MIEWLENKVYENKVALKSPYIKIFFNDNRFGRCAFICISDKFEIFSVN
jgi:hypothetical protein